MTKTAFVILGAILTATTHTTVASAQDRPVQAITYADLDLSSDAGRGRLSRRIDVAVRRVCGRAWPIDLGAVAEVRRCRADTSAEIAAARHTGEAYVAEIALR